MAEQAPWEQAPTSASVNLAPWEQQTPPPKPALVNPQSDKAVVKAIPEVLPMIGGIVGEGPIGAAAGSALGLGLKNLAPSVFGDPGSGAHQAINFGADTVLQGLLPKGVETALSSDVLRSKVANLLGGSFLKNFPAIKEGAAKSMTDSILRRYQFPETGILESAASNAANVKDELTSAYKEAVKTHMASDAYTLDPESVSPEMQATAQELGNKFGKNSVGAQLNDLQRQFEAGGEVAGNQTYKQIAGTALSDVQHVRNFKLATGEPETIEQLALNDLVTNSFKDSNGTVNAASILDKLSGPKKEIYSEAIDPAQLATFRDFLTELQGQEKGGAVDSIVRYSGKHLMWSAGPTLGVGSILGHEGIAAASMIPSGSVVLTNSMLGKLMSDPQMAQLVVKAMKTPVSSPEASLISQALAHGARALGVGALTNANNTTATGQ